jgi:hypothetical protein
MQSVIIESRPAPLPTDYDMPINETDKGWIRQEINAVFDKRSGRGLLKIIRDWSGTSAAVGILIFFITQWGNYTEFRTHTNDTLTSIGTHLEKIDNDLLEVRASQFPGDVLHEINGLPDTKFAKAFPALRKAAEAPIGETKLSQPLIGGISAKLLTTNNGVPDYWPTVLQFLEFASATVAPTKVPASGSMAQVFSRAVLSNDEFTGATVVLDGGAVRDTKFINCRVIFTDTPVQMERVLFINSVFELPVSAAPSPYIQKASRLLLASDLKTVSISSL